MLKDCSKHLNIAQETAHKLEYLKKSDNAAHFVLANLCYQLDLEIPIKTILKLRAMTKSFFRVFLLPQHSIEI